MTDAQYQNEILEAIEAANVALKALHNAESDLKSAGGWGISHPPGTGDRSQRSCDRGGKSIPGDSVLSR